jgi:polyhydroxyalkanoate synthesis regulator protein
VENAKGKPTGLPLELLRQLVVASDHAGQEFISWYLKSAFDTYQKLQGAIQGGLSEMQTAPSLSPLSMVKKFVQGTAAPAHSGNREVEELKARLAEMEARLKNPKKTPRPRKPRQPAS